MQTRARIATIGLAVISAVTAWGQTPIITTAAGTGTAGFSGDNGPATKAQVGSALTVAVDNSGNLIIVDQSNNRIRRVSASTGIITTIAGGGPATGDGGPATGAQVFPGAAAFDGAGNMYIAQGASIRKVNTSGIISTIAGNGLPGFSGDGGPATQATISLAVGIAADQAGNVYVADTTNSRIRKIDTSGIMTTVAGTGQSGYSGDGGPATSAKLALPQGVAVDSIGNLYFADNATHIRKVTASTGVITTVAGSGTPIVTGDGGQATSAGMSPSWVTVDSSGNLFICDTGSKRIRKVNTSGVISTYAGGALNTGTGNGDGGPATSGVLTNISAVAVDPSGNIYIADSGARNVREVSSGVSASPVAVSPGALSFSVNQGSPAPPSQSVVITSPGASLTFTAAATTTSGGNWLSVTPTSGNVNNTLTVSVNPAGLTPAVYHGTVTITPSGAGNTPQTVTVTFTVNAVGSSGVISTIAGNGNVPFSAPGASATSTNMAANAVTLDASGNVYVADTVSSRVYKVTTTGAISVIAGNGTFGFSGDNGPGTSAALFTPIGLAVDSGGNVYIADSGNNRIRKVTPGGTISTFAGNGSTGFTGDGGPATAAGLFSPFAIAFDSAGNLYIADESNFRIRKVNTSGVISTIAGTLLPGFGGDGGPATSASLLLPGGLAVDSSNNVYLADVGNNRIRKINGSGIISTVAGNGSKGYSGDGGAATSAMFNFSNGHIGLAVDAAGNLYIPDPGNNRLRKVDTSGVVTTVAGNGVGGFSGDGGPATSAGLNSPTDVALDSSGNLYIADTTNNRVRKVTVSSAGGTPSIAANGIVNGASFLPGLVANSWGTIQGSNLSAATDTWANAIVNGNLPTSLDGVSVKVSGQAAYVYYVSPTQINFIAPNVAAGSAQVIVTTTAGASSTFTVNLSQYGPAFFTWPNNQPVATRRDFSLAVAPGTFAGANTVAAKAGDVIILWGTGFGPTIPAAPVGVQTPSDRTYATSSNVSVTLNGIAATVYGAALAPGFAGLYQVAIQIPLGLPDGNWPIIATVNGVASPNNVNITIKN